MSHNDSWFLRDHLCRECNYPVVVTQGKEWDYRYYCSNPDCEHHNDPADLGDQEDFPEWCKKDKEDDEC